MSSYRDISERLKVGIWQSPASFMREAENWIAQTNFDVNQYGTKNSDITSDPDFYGYNRNSSKTITIFLPS